MKSMVLNSKILRKSKEKTFGTYLELSVSSIKPVNLYASSRQGESKKKFFCKQIEQLHISMSKQILVTKKCTNNIKILSQLGRILLKVDIKTRTFKYLPKFSFIETKRYLSTSFKKADFKF